MFVQKPDLLDGQDLRLVADRVRVYPKSVHGTVRRVKWLVLILCLAVYYILPWLRWDRGPGRPSQAFLLDIWHERLYLLNWEFWPQEVYFLTGLLVMGAFGLFLATGLAGRVWCGFTCPQTVWTDLFMLVERWLEGDRNVRMKRDSQPLTLDAVWRKTAKHVIWLAIAAATGGAWVMYFIDAPTVVPGIFRGQATVWVYVFVVMLTATTYLLAGWAREQVCTFMCPWPRFQAAMVDEHSIIVTYQGWRGEPRGHLRAAAGPIPRGDCVDCHQCVNACPTGIDIRDGSQLECIGCGLCIDACDEVMTKVERPKALITWDSLARQSARARGECPPHRFVRARTLLYASVLGVVAVAMLTGLGLRKAEDLTVQRDRTPLFVRLADGRIRNGYEIKLVNKHAESVEFELTAAGAPVTLEQAEAGALPSAALHLRAAPDAVTSFRVLAFGSVNATGSTPLTFVLRNPETGAVVEHQSVFLGPGAS